MTDLTDIDVKRLRLDQTDIVVVRTAHPIPIEAAERVRTALREQLGSAGVHNKILVHGPEITLEVVAPEEIPCPVDVQNESAVSPNGSSNASSPPSPESSAASLVKVVSRLLQMHNELLATVGTLVQQNERMLEALGMTMDDDEDEPRTYLDGTPVDRPQ